MKTIFAALMLTGSFAHAAITSDFDCVTKDGAKVHFEAQTGIFDEQGNITGEYLYRNTIWITVNGIETKFTPDRSIVSGASALLGAWSKDGQYVLVNANYKVKDEGDSRDFEGTIEFSVKSEKGTLKRKEGTQVSCNNYGEA